MNQKPAFIIAATKSGAGKTTLTLGIMSAFVKRGYRVQPYKCGPDFIDPTLHRLVTGNISYNLDLKMMGERCCQETFARQGSDSDILIIEGVMGLFDGGDSSTAALAKALKLPVFLIIDAQSSAESAAAVLTGFELYDPQIRLAGVIFNKIGSARHRELIDAAVSARSSVPVIGYMMREKTFHIPERHLGLYMGNENPIDTESLETLASRTETHLDLDQILNKSGRSEIDAAQIDIRAEKPHLPLRQPLRVGISMDEAFCFYYQQNLDLFAQAGFTVVPFSPLHDTTIPADLQMIYFCGGYPENFAAELANNRSMLESVRQAHCRDIPIYGECGGFMFLCQSLIDNNKEVHEMAGVFPFQTRMNKRLRRLGYRRATLQEPCLLGKEGDVLYGHEFHYSDLAPLADLQDKNNKIKLLYTLDNRSHEGYTKGSAIGSYVHLHFGKTPAVFRHIAAQIGQ